MVSDYLLDSGTNVEPHVLVKKGLDLYNQNIRDLSCMKVLLRAMAVSGYKEEKLAKYRNEFAEIWPEIAVA